RRSPLRRNRPRPDRRDLRRRRPRPWRRPRPRQATTLRSPGSASCSVPAAATGSTSAAPPTDRPRRGGRAVRGGPARGAGGGRRGGGAAGPRHVHRIVLGGPQGRRMMMRRGMAMRLAALDLTEAQKTRLRDLHEAAARKSVQRRADLQLARMDLHQLMRAESPSASAVNAQIDKLARLQSAGMKARFDTFMQARAVLTPEQLKKLRSPMEMREPPRHDGD